MIVTHTSRPFGRSAPQPDVPDAIRGIGRIATKATAAAFSAGYGYRRTTCSGVATLALADGTACGSGGEGISGGGTTSGSTVFLGRENGRTFELPKVLGNGGSGSSSSSTAVVSSPFPPRPVDTPVFVDGATHGVYRVSDGAYLGIWDDLTGEPWSTTKDGLEWSAGWAGPFGEGLDSWLPEIGYPLGGTLTGVKTTMRAGTPWRNWAAIGAWVMGSGVAVDWDSVEPVSSGTKPTADPVPYLTPECGPDAIGVWDVSETDPHLYALMEVGAAPADPTLPESAHAWFAGPEGVFMAHDVGGRAVRCYSLPPGIDTAPAAVDAMVRPPYPDAPAVALASSSSASKDWARYDPVFYVVTFYGGSGEGHASLPSLLWVNFAQRNRDRDVVLPVGPAGTTGRRLYRGVQGDYESAYWYPRLVVDIPDNTTTTFLDTVASASLGAIPPAGPDYLPYGIRHELYVYAVACCVDGGWGRLSPFSAKIATWSDYYSTGVIDVTVAPGPTGTTSRRVYRAAWPTGGAPPSPSDFHLISEVSGNEAAVVHDRMGEGSWGAAPPEVELTATEVITLSATGWTAGSWIDRIDTI